LAIAQAGVAALKPAIRTSGWQPAHIAVLEVLKALPCEKNGSSGWSVLLTK
jgi:hypothetical protein